MAILLYFRKIDEDERQVEYAFGRDFTVLDRRLVVEKASEHGEPSDGNRDHAFAAVYGKILRYHRTEARWPAGGEYAA